MKTPPLLILIAGISGVGKSTMTKKISESIQQSENNKEAVVVFETDYLTNADLKNMPFPYLKDGVIDFLAKAEYMNSILNFDEDLILDKIKEAANKEQTKVIVVEGSLAFSFEKIKNFAELKIYIKADDDIRLIRRIQRRNYYKKIIGEMFDKVAQEDFRAISGNSLKEELDLWIVRKKIKSLDRDYDKNFLAIRKYANLILSNNYQEDYEENFKKISTLIDLYFKDKRRFEDQLKERSRESSRG